MQFKKNALETKILDLSDISWFFPTCLLPLGVFIKEHKEICVIPPKDDDVSKYINIIMKEKIKSKKSYIPIIELLPNRSLIEKTLENLISSRNLNKENLNAIGYYIGELLDNVYEHSRFSTAYIMAQRYKTFTEIGIIDNGISIPGSYESKGLGFNNDIEALEKALEGLSTKNIESENPVRGYGLSSSLKLLTDGFNANCLIVSRGAGLVTDKSNRFFCKKEEINVFNSTLISSRFLNNIREVNVYDYVEE